MSYDKKGDEVKKNYKIAVGMAIVTLLLISIFVQKNIPLATAMRVVSEQPLQGIVIVLDSGHGGKDDGAQIAGVKEDEINLSIAKALQTLLEQAGAQVKMTRDGDFDLADQESNRKKADMKKRIEIINEPQVDLFLSIHLNSYPDPKVKGAQTFYQKGHQGQELFAKHMQEALKKAIDTKMTSKAGDYYILNETKVIGTLVECGFLSNGEERERLVQSSYQNQIAQALYEGIVSFFEILQ